MSEQSATPETGALSVDQAIASLLPAAEPVEQEQPASEAPLEAAETPTEPEGESSSPKDAEDGAETPAEGEEAEVAPEPEKLDAPLYWKPEAKAKFDALDPELQAEILAQEGPREESAAKAKAEAAKLADEARQERAGVQALADQLSQFLPQAIETFKSRWGEQEPDWAATAEQYGDGEAFKLKVKYEAEQKQLLQVAQANQTAAIQAENLRRESEFETLHTLDKELAPDPRNKTEGAEARAKVVSYLKSNGIPETAISKIAGIEMVIAKKAMLYDQGQAALKAAPKPKPAAPAQRSPVRPAAAAVQSSSSSIAKQVRGRFDQKPDIDNAVALLLASKG